MKVALTGASGFIGHYIARQLCANGHTIRAWRRPSSNVESLADINIEWVTGELGAAESADELLQECQAVVHAAHWKPGQNFQGDEGPLDRFTQTNIVGSLRLIMRSAEIGIDRFVFLSTCAVYHQILDDRKLDEQHPCRAGSHYGATKAAIEQFVHSYSNQNQLDICALRPCAVYGLHHQVESSRWYQLVKRVARGQNVQVQGGAKMVHAADVAKATGVLLEADSVNGQIFNCYDQFIDDLTVATIAKEISGSPSSITGQPKQPAHQIETEKLENIGMSFGGLPMMERTIAELVRHSSEKNVGGSAKP